MTRADWFVVSKKENSYEILRGPMPQELACNRVLNTNELAVDYKWIMENQNIILNFDIYFRNK